MQSMFQPVMVFLWLYTLIPALPAGAQTPPSPMEVAAYTGLHKAAASGNATDIHKYAKDKAALAAIDSNGRTPLHVAAFLKRREAIILLIKAGANTGALDNQK